MKHFLPKTIYFLVFLFLPHSIFSEEPPLECRLKLSPLSFTCLNQDEIKNEKKIRQNVFIPESQIEVFKNLKKKEQDIERKKQQQLTKNVELRQIEERIEQKLNALRQEREQYETLRQEKIKFDEKNIARLVVYYEKMDPENSSKFLNTMDLNTASKIIMQMNPRKGSKVLELLDVPMAVKITEAVAGFKKNLDEAKGIENPNRNLPQALN